MRRDEKRREEVRTEGMRRGAKRREEKRRGETRPDQTRKEKIVAFYVFNVYVILLCISDVMQDLYDWVNPKTGLHSPMVSKKFMELVMKNAKVSKTKI